MMKNRSIFRKKTLERISSPEQLTDYLRVTDPGIWVFLSAVILLLVGMLAWAAVGTIETVAAGKAVVEDGRAEVIITDSVDGDLATGMPIRIAKEESVVSKISEDEYGRALLYCETALPDGTYDADIITEQIHPIRFLIDNR